MSITITAFDHSPDGGRGLARDCRVRWALEEVGQPYDVLGVTFPDLKKPAHLARQPFGQIPSYDDGTVSLFESGAIILHIAETWPGLFPDDAAVRARAITWMFAAVSTVEPPILDLENTNFTERDKPWYPERRSALIERIHVRLRRLSDWLGDKDWLEGSFTAGDIMMIGVLLRISASGILADHPNLAAYVARGEARPAYQRAFAAQRAWNTR
jgi:glutathione S-transferase